MPSRRSTLGHAAGGLAFALGGCLRTGENDGRSVTDDPTDTAPNTPAVATLDWGEPFEGDNFEVAPTAVAADSSFVHIDGVDHGNVVDGDRWFAFVTLSAAGDAPPDPGAFSLVDDAVDRAAWTDFEMDASNISAHRDGNAYLITDEHTTGWVGIDVPYGATPSAPAIELERDGDAVARWPLPESAAERVQAEPPDFAVESIDAPDSNPHDEPFDIDVTVRNDGGPGTFRAVVNYTEPLYDNDAGETSVVTHSVSVHTSGIFDEAETPFPVDANVRTADDVTQLSVEIE
jgi:hypothetical protein